MKLRYSSRICILVLTLIYLMMFPSEVRAETEPNDTPGQANPLALGVVGDTSATLSSSSDEDWFRVTLTQDKWYLFETYNVSPILKTRLTLYHTDGSTQLANYTYGCNASGNICTQLVWQAPVSGDFYLRVRSYSGAGLYSVRVLRKYDDGAIWDSFHEPNDHWQTAYLIGAGRENAIATTIYPRGPYSTNTGDYDYFRFEATLGQWYVVETFNVAPTLNSRIALYDVDGTTQLANDDYRGTGNSDARIVWQAPQTAVFYILVWAYSSSQEGLYSLRVLPKYDQGASWDSNGEPDDAWVTASPVILNQTLSRSMYQRGNYYTNNADYDYFWFPAQAGYEYTIDMMNVAPTLRGNLYLIGLNGSTVLASDTSYVAPGSAKSLTHAIYTSGVYYVLVRPYSNSSYDYGEYDIEISTSDSATLFISNHEMRFVGMQGGANPSAEWFVITNSGSSSFDWEVSSNATWLGLSSTMGSAGSSTVVEVTPNITGLTPGDYEGEITVSSDGIFNSPETINVSLRVDPPIVTTTETESNDTAGTANALAVGWLHPATARFPYSNDEDWYRVSLTASHWYIFETYDVSRHLKTRLTLYYPDGSTQLANYTYGCNATGNICTRIIWQASASGDYFLRVRSYSGEGPYSVRVLRKYGETATWDGFHEPNDNWQTAHMIEVGRENAVTTTIYPRGPFSTNTGDYDYFQFGATLGHWYVIETFNVAPTLNSRIALYDVDGTTQLANDDYRGTGNSDARIVWQAPQTAVFYIRVWAYSSSQEGLYSLRVLPKYDQGASWDSNWEPDDRWVTATPVILNQTQSRSMYQRGNYLTNYADYDYFWFTAQAGYEYTINMLNVSATLRANLYLISLDGTTVLTSDAIYQSPGTPKSFVYTFATPGTYYILVRPYSSSSYDYGDYDLRVTSVVPAIHVNKEKIDITSEPCATSTEVIQVNIGNSGLGAFDWSLAASEVWLKFSPTGGSAPPNTSVDVWADLTGMPAGDYTANLTITAAGVENSPYIIPVNLNIELPYCVFLPLIMKE